MNDDGVGKDDSKRSFSQDYVANVYAAAAALIRRCTSMRPTEILSIENDHAIHYCETERRIALFVYLQAALGR